ncbi:GH3 auxin-responsive promoter family protein [Pseudanabaena sp. PCC 6802]|uniref:GH3 auxin-responsive promoter family protein n=1 Tax=Pseudanabaena sp. PCC 6802 TaxID=118173 RepID=UPI00034A2B94|nr:GH3 auxin-responsive promoter family protein [Pseudanabaena sp. PCC 6802]
MLRFFKDRSEQSFFSPLFRQVAIFIGRILLHLLRLQMLRATQANSIALRRIIARNQHSEFGQQHRFSSLLKDSQIANKYKSLVPLSSYQDYEAAIARMKQGEPNILVSEPLVSFAATAGTMGLAKIVPRTRSHLRVPMKISGLLNPAIGTNYFLKGKPRGKGICLLTGAGAIETTQSGATVEEHSSMGMRRVAKMIPHLWCSPAEVFAIDDDRTARYLHALYGLRDDRVQYIAATYAPYVLQWLIDMESRWSELVDDIESGTLSENLTLPPAARQSLAANLTPDPARAAVLRAATASGFRGIAPRIWPQMAYVETVTTGSFSIYVPALQFYLGNIPLFSSFYGSSEAAIGIGLWPDRPGDYALPLGSAYYEFIPLSDVDKEHPRTVDLDSLKIGESYEVVVTNLSGFYRYRIGDIVKIAGRYFEAPILNFSHRRGTTLDLAGEKTNEAHVKTTIDRLTDEWMQEMDSCWRDYTAAIDSTTTTPSRYVFYIELLGDIVPSVAIATIDRGAQLLDKALGDVNRAYRLQRRQGSIGMPQVKLLASGSFSLLSEKRNLNQLKIPRYLTNKQQIDLLESRVIAASDREESHNLALA